LEEQYHRYSRNIARLGKDGQKRLREAKVLVCGLGGLGSGVVAALGGYGIGKIGLLDFDTVQLSNLNRQFIHRNCDVGKTKTSSAARFLEEFNPEIVQVLYNKKLDENFVLQGFDVVIDCFDNFESKLLLNRLAVQEGVSLVHGGVEDFKGQVITIKPAQTACLACVLGDCKEPAMSLAALPSAVNTISAIQANECVKILLSLEGTLYNKLLRLDLLKYEFKVVNLEKNPKCKVCG